MKKHYLSLLTCTLLLLSIQSCKDKKTEPKLFPNKPLVQETEHEDESINPDKFAEWTAEDAAKNQAFLAKMAKQNKGIARISATGKLSGTTSYANGALNGAWLNRGPKNMPGAFKFVEMLDGTDIMYGVTWNHYAAEYNSKSYIFKGTVYNPTTGTGGDDFELLTAYWPNRYKNLFAINMGAGAVRLVAHIENGHIYYSDDEGTTWTKSTGQPTDAIMSATINKQDNNAIYICNPYAVFVSTDLGASFSRIVTLYPSYAYSCLYSPRYNIQNGANNVYWARSGKFFKLNATKNGFTQVGTYTNNHGNTRFSIAGDSRKLYITVDEKYWASTDQGATWTEKTPEGRYYANNTGSMFPGFSFSVHPENPDIVIGGYTVPILSTDGLETRVANHRNWDYYQYGNLFNDNLSDYYNRIRFNFHPDFQGNQFFYNASGNLFTARSSDGGIFVSYKEWTDFPPDQDGSYFNRNYDYSQAHYINLNVVNTVSALVYRGHAFTGARNPGHIFFSTQDQGSQNTMPTNRGGNFTANLLDFDQAIGGDGPPFGSENGEHVWKWKREGNGVYAPISLYKTSGEFKNFKELNAEINTTGHPFVSFTKNTNLGWVQNYIDKHEPDKRIWLLSKELHRAEWNGTNLTGHTVSLGSDTNQIAALAQGSVNGNIVYILKGGKIYKSTDRGNTFDSGTSTMFSQTTNSYSYGDVGSGIVLPGNDNWILFCGPSTNNTGALLSEDGGTTWTDVTGIFPAGNDAQTSGLVATPGGEFIFAGTDVGPYVFDVATKTWHAIGNGIGYFNAMDVDYIESTKTVRFATWGSGILDFNIDENSLSTTNSIANSNTVQATLYPNPAKNFVNISLENNTINYNNVTISVFNMNGQKVLSKQHNFNGNTPIKLATSNLATGMYLVNITSNNKKIATKKLIIK